MYNQKERLFSHFGKSGPLAIYIYALTFEIRDQ